MELRTDSGQVFVIDESQQVGFGKRGTVYSLSESFGDARHLAAKVFLPRYRTQARMGKVKRLVELGKRCPARGAWPLALLFEGDEWAGYLMPLIKGRLVDDAIYDDDVSPADRLEISAQICEMVKLLHRHWIVLGDLSTRNFIFEKVEAQGSSWFTVYVIDLDSAQVIGDDNSVYVVTECKERSPEMPDVLGESLLSSHSDDYLAAVAAFKMLFRIDPRDEVKTDALPVEIREHNARNRVFAYKRRPNAVPIDLYGKELADLFERSFEKGAYNDIPTCFEYETAFRSALLGLG